MQVSWIRHADTHLLTTGMYRYTPDLRFAALHKPSSENWVLELRNTSREDQGPSSISSFHILHYKFFVIENYRYLITRVSSIIPNTICHSIHYEIAPRSTCHILMIFIFTLIVARSL